MGLGIVHTKCQKSIKPRQILMLKISQIYGTFELDRLVGIFLLKIFFLHI